MESEGIYLLSAIIGSGGMMSIMLKWITGRLTDGIDKVNQSIQTLTLTQMELYKLFLAHDAQVRGINPSTGEDQKSRDTEAEKNFRNLNHSIENLTKIIESNIGLQNRRG